VRLDRLRQGLHFAQTQRCGAHHGATGVLRAARAFNQAIALHAREHAGQAGSEQIGFAGDAASFCACQVMGMLTQHPQHTPLLVRQAMLAQAWTRVSHDGFACLQQQAR
jgi:hypothetical protein